MNNVVTEIKKIVKQAVEASGVSGDIDDVEIERPKEEGHGDYSCNTALKFSIFNFQFSKIKTPYEIAQKIVEIMRKKGLPEFLEKIKVAGPGFINFWLAEGFLVERMAEGEEGREGKEGREGEEKKKIMVEYGHPNTHKEMHIGHMRTLITGEALARVLAVAGATVFRANYQGDIGPHVAKSIWGTERLLQERNLTWEQAESLTLTQKAHLLGEGYVRGTADYEQFQNEITLLNNKLYQKEATVWLIYERTRKWSLDYYDAFYKRFNTQYDKLYFESEVAEEGKKIVAENVNKVFQESEGAIIFDGEPYGLHKRVFITKEGNATYEGKDMGLAYKQYNDFAFDKCVHVVANEQAGYFQVIIKALELLDKKFIDREYHLSMGMVQLIGRKISSRTGEIITVDGLLEEVKGLVRPMINGEGLTDEEKNNIAEKVTLAAVKYSVLRVSPTMNVSFDIKQSVSLEGDSGPYLLYTYARGRSVLGKVNDKNYKDYKNYKINEEEKIILRTLYRFPEVIAAAARNYGPNLICNYLFDLAKKFNDFYGKYRILEEQIPKNFRIILTQSVVNTLKKGLELLNIETLERM